MTHRIGAKGQVVIPKELREEALLEPGTGVSFEPVEGGVLIRPAGRRRRLRGRFASSGMAARLLEDRDKEPR
jgi:AbrB family looped-hinge helix DNA binding protein